jgi:2-dehydropantoate 2-reductase
MRAAAGDITAAGGEYIIRNVLGEASRIAADNGFPPSEAATERAHKVLLAPGATITASMMRDIERGGPVETDHLFGAMLRRANPAMAHPMIDLILVHLKAYEARRAREGKA